MPPPPAIRVAKAAKRLTDFIGRYQGETADWPMSITFDNDEYAEAFCKIMNDLQDRIDEVAQSYRAKKSEQTAVQSAEARHSQGE